MHIVLFFSGWDGAGAGYLVYATLNAGVPVTFWDLWGAGEGGGCGVEWKIFQALRAFRRAG